MGEYDAVALEEAARSYGLLRGPYRQFFWGMPALAIVFLPSIKLAELSGIFGLKALLVGLFGIGWAICWAGCFGMGLALFGFRCPRCLKRFVWAWWSNLPSDRCKHCGLDLGPSVLAAKKPLADPDLW